MVVNGKGERGKVIAHTITTIIQILRRQFDPVYDFGKTKTLLLFFYFYDINPSYILVQQCCFPKSSKSSD